MRTRRAVLSPYNSVQLDLSQAAIAHAYATQGIYTHHVILYTRAKTPDWHQRDP